MQVAVAAITCAVFAILSLWHVYWALGGRLAHEAALPFKDGEPLFRPSAVGTFMVGVILMAFAGLAAANGGLLSLDASPAWLRWAGGAVALALVGRAIGDFRYVGFFKRLGEDPFARLDTRVYSPLCMLLAAGMIATIWRG
ncbi:DUF3995 domain-containing protein [Achromobacter sp. Bel]|uniref:DUF3995 domain-containing protein n=1 Tax=Achromobacter sp. Bel TaxID=2727415 RepID=UPI00145F5B19|nr:DUF3995 domain-containing protein [Achromobacter sp. Bel]NMK46047.1 DUF3995 domain-containing protein [Achromobacter sp. Bel]